MPDNSKRCVVTGLGLVCALGDDAASCAASAFSGKSGIKDVASFDTANCYSHKGAEVDLSDSELCKDKYDRTTLLCIKAAGEAIADSGLGLEKEDRTRAGVILGTCIGGAASIDKYYRDSHEGKPADKEDITRIEYEPWHIRYVGVNHAAYMYLHNLCLEEYVELQEKAATEAADYALEHPATVE